MTLKNTDNSYRIIVRNKQTIDTETDVIEEIAYGSYSEKNGKRYIRYRTETDDNSVSSIIIIDGSSLTIKRRGHVNSSMVYRAGRKHSFPYQTPYGILDMEIETDKLIVSLDEDGGSIELIYTLTVQGEQYFNDMKILISKR